MEKISFNLISNNTFLFKLDLFFIVFRSENESDTQMVEYDERTRMEGHSLVRHASLYYRQNQTSNS